MDRKSRFKIYYINRDKKRKSRYRHKLNWITLKGNHGKHSLALLCKDLLVTSIFLPPECSPSVYVHWFLRGCLTVLCKVQRSMKEEWTMLQKPRNTAELSQSLTSEVGTSCNASRNSTPVTRQFKYERWETIQVSHGKWLSLAEFRSCASPVYLTIIPWARVGYEVIK